jgi:hypothetical protein
LAAKRLELLRELVPGANRITVLVNPADAPNTESTLSRDSPDESQTGINVRVFSALLQDRREVLTATSTSGNPNAWSRV